MPSMYSRTARARARSPPTRAARRRRSSGWTQKISGMTAIADHDGCGCAGSRAAPCGRWPGPAWCSMLIAGPPPVLVDQLEVDVLERVVRLADRQHVGAGRDQSPGDGGRGDGRVGDGEDVGGRAVLVPAVDGREAAEDAARVGERDEGPDRERPGEQLVAQLVGPADGAQRRVQDRDTVAEALGLLQAMGGEEDRHPALAERVDQLVDLAGGDRVQAGRRLVQEQHLRVAEQRPGQGDPLAQPFGQGAAGVAGPVGQVDRPQRAVDAIAVGRAPRTGRRSTRGSRSRSGAGTAPATRA